MTAAERKRILSEIRQLRSLDPQQSGPRSVESRLVQLVSRVLEEDEAVPAYPVTLRVQSETDALYDLGGMTIGLEVSQRRVNTDAVQRTLEYVSATLDLDRLIWIGVAGFTERAIRLADHSEPTVIEFLDFDRLRAWVSNIPVEDESDPIDDPLVLAIKDFSRRLAEVVAEDPSILENLEWPDVERMMAEVFDGLGFEVEPTPLAKDGGKDIILQCWILGDRKKYFVEVKHWIGTRVGSSVVRDFVTVVIDEGADRGLVLATTGYTSKAFEGLTEVERLRVRGGDSGTILRLCRTYIRVKGGLFVPRILYLPNLPFNGTLPVQE